ncbi:MAG: nucleotide exchange factor GrpE [Bacteriovoracaceae bacterium]|jgi:molecular chaperone GrpE|nr:nucleotide exchange factor GrpE [Bacteriovoracaceae bacterium]
METTETEEVKLEENEQDTVEDNVESIEEAKEAKEAKEEDSFKDKYYYLAAEMQNMQRRFDKEKENLLKFGSEKILRDLLDVVDNFERTLGFIKDDQDEKIKNLYVGLDMVSKQFIEALSKHGLKRVDALGNKFDPNFHEALAQQPSEGKEDMEILQVHQEGYTLNERLIRPSKVVVVKN